jgi:hypothetical protein
MKYLILDGLLYRVRFQNGAYRGTDRREPPCVAELPAESEVNRWGLWYIGELEEFGGIRELAKARECLRFCNRYFPDRHFEVIGISGDKEPPNDVAKLLGFDISFAGASSSLISTGLIAGPYEQTPEKPILVLDDLLRRYFYPKLNEFGLFQTFEDAAHCRHAMIALHNFDPNLYEGGSLEVFKVTGVYLISDREKKSDLS